MFELIGRIKDTNITIKVSTVGSNFHLPNVTLKNIITKDVFENCFSIKKTNRKHFKNNF